MPAEEAARLGRRAEVGRGGARPGFGAGGGGTGRALQATSASLLLPFFLSLRVRSQPHDTGERRSHPKATGGHEGKRWIPMFFISYFFAFLCFSYDSLEIQRGPEISLLWACGRWLGRTWLERATAQTSCLVSSTAISNLLCTCQNVDLIR